MNRRPDEVNASWSCSVAHASRPHGLKIQRFNG